MRTFLVACLLAPASALASSQANLDLSAWLGRESNASRALTTDPALLEVTQGLRLTSSHSWLLTEHSGAVVRGSGALENHSRFSDLDNASARIEVAYRHQPVLGFSHPWFEAGGYAEMLRYAASEIRDGFLYGASASVARYFTDRIFGRAGLGEDRRVAPYEDVFDTRSFRVYGEVTYVLPTGPFLQARFTRATGDQVFSTLQGTSALRSYAASEDDPAFGPGYYAYRVDAVTRIVDLAATVPTGAQSSFIVSASRYDATTPDQLEYVNTVLRLTYAYRLY